MSKLAFITGITGQDGSYLAELLLEKKYIVYGMIRRSSSWNTERIEHIRSQLCLKYGDLIDSSCILCILNEMMVSHSDFECLEIYNLGAMSHVKVSSEMPVYSTQVNSLGTLHVLEAIRLLILENDSLREKIKFYQASTSELYGKIVEKPQTEETPFQPQSPYAISKLYSYYITQHYREAYHLFACNGILFNHESERRGMTFVTQKIVYGLARIKLGLETELLLGNLYSKRDWGHAKDYVYAQWLILQSCSPEDYVIATGEQYSVKEFVERVGRELQLGEIKWEGEGVQEVGKMKDQIIIRIDPKYFRNCEVEDLLGDARKAHEKLGWKPKISIDELVKEMVQGAMKKIR